MQKSNLTTYLSIFIGIWAIWSVWDAIEPLLNFYQLATLFLFVPLSALLLAFSFLEEDKDDDDFGDGLLQPILLRKKPSK